MGLLDQCVLPSRSPLVLISSFSHRVATQDTVFEGMGRLMMLYTCTTPEMNPLICDGKNLYQVQTDFLVVGGTI